MKKHNARGYCMKNNDGANSRINWGALRDVQVIEAGAAPDQRKAFAFIDCPRHRLSIPLF